MTKQKRITLATVKSFIRKNMAKLHLRVESNFDGMQDMVVQKDNPQFHPIELHDEPEKLNETMKNATLGIRGVWFVRDGNLLTPVDNESWFGYNVYNVTGEFTIAIKKA